LQISKTWAFYLHSLSLLVADAIHPSQDGAPLDNSDTVSVSELDADLGDVADFLCDECSEGFESPEEQQLHSEEVHGREDYEHSLSPQNTNLLIDSGKMKSKEWICDKCGELFHKNRDIYRHMTSHLVTSNYTQPFKSRRVVCKLCNEQVQETFLYSHLVQSHSNFKSTKVDLSCPICSYHGSEASHFYRHLRLRHVKRILECEPCQMAFKSFEFLKKHALGQHNIDLDKYSAAPVKFTIARATPNKTQVLVVKRKIKKPILKRKIKELFSKRKVKEPFSKRKVKELIPKSKLETCSVQLTPAITSSNMFICSECNEIFTEKAELQKHVVKSCKGRRKQGRPSIPFDCAFCKLKCSNAYIYATHLILQHSHYKAPNIQTNRKCSYCSARFSKLLDLCRHARANHRTPSYCCLICNKITTTIWTLQMHMNKDHMIEQLNPKYGNPVQPQILETHSPSPKEFKAKQLLSNIKRVPGNKIKETAEKWKITSISEEDKSPSPNLLLPDATEFLTKTENSVQESKAAENPPEETSAKTSESAQKSSPAPTISPQKMANDSASNVQDSSAKSKYTLEELVEATKPPPLALSSLKELSTKAVNALKESSSAPEAPCCTNLTDDVENTPPATPLPASPALSPSPAETDEIFKEEADLPQLQDPDVKLFCAVRVTVLRIPSLDANVMSSVLLPKGTKEFNLQRVLSSMVPLNGDMVPKMGMLSGKDKKSYRKWEEKRKTERENYYKDIHGRWQCRICKFQSVCLSTIQFHTSQNHTEEAQKSQQPLVSRFMASPENNLKMKTSIIETLNAEIKNFECVDCSKRFNSLMGLNKHRLWKHNPDTKLPWKVEIDSTTGTAAAANVFCDNCKKGFKTLFSWRIHQGKMKCGTTAMFLKPEQEQEEKDVEQTQPSPPTVIKVEPEDVLESKPTKIKEEVSISSCNNFGDLCWQLLHFAC
jgi:hypothetical protein